MTFPAPYALPGQFHDPVPDGRTGPFLRKRHERLPGGLGYAFDSRCPACTAALGQRYLIQAEAAGRMATNWGGIEHA